VSVHPEITPPSNFHQLRDTTLERPERIKQIEEDYEQRLARAKVRRPKNPLRANLSEIEIDEAYGTAEVAASCIICHK
jgi:hypothetical protein